MTNLICILLGGRAGTETLKEAATPGASDDLTRATAIAWSMEARLGLGSSLGSYPETWRGKSMSDRKAKEVEDKVEEVLRRELDRAKAILERNRDVAGLLMRKMMGGDGEDGKDTLRAEEIAQFWEMNPVAGEATG